MCNKFFPMQTVKIVHPVCPMDFSIGTRNSISEYTRSSVVYVFPLGCIRFPGNTDPCVHDVHLSLRGEHLALRRHLGESAFQPI